jgi:APA family basic amino acid/polyamine antiporter
MARRLPGIQRLIDAPALAGVAYGEIGSSLYIALGVVVLYALGYAPWTLLAVGLVFFLVALSYAEGIAAMPEPGGAAGFVRRAFNDPAAFVTGWALFLDYLVVMALASLFVPHYLGSALEWDGLTDSPWDVVCGVCVVAGVAGARLVRRTRIRRVAIVVAAIAFFTQVLLAVLGFALVVSAGDLTDGLDLGTAPSWSSIVFALALATLAYTGLETVANYAAEIREPGRALPRSLFAAVALVVVVATVVGVVGAAAYPFVPDDLGPDGVASALGTVWNRAPLVGIVVSFSGSLPSWAVDSLRFFVGVTGVVVLVAAVTTSMSGAGRLAYSLARREMLPRAFGRITARASVAPASVVAAAVLSAALMVGAAVIGSPVRGLAGLYSFGVLLAFAAAQLAVLRLRVTEPDLARPFRVPLGLRVRGAVLPLPTLVGFGLTCLLWIGALATHASVRIAGPVWLAVGAIVFVAVRRREHAGLRERVEPARGDLVPAFEGEYGRILVPLKISGIGEEVLATALKLAEERRARVHVVHVLRVPLERKLDEPLPDEEERALASIEEAREIGGELGVQIDGHVVRARSIGEAIVDLATGDGTDVVVLGSAPRWRRQSRFFSPTVDYVLRHAPCQVMVIAYPEGVLEEEPAG